MTHLDPDALALAAMNESLLGGGELEHLAECADCSRELAALRRTADVARSAAAVELEEPADAVWGRIHDELGLSAAVEASPLPHPADITEPDASGTSLAPRVRSWKGWLPFAATWLAIRGRKAPDDSPEATSPDSSPSPQR